MTTYIHCKSAAFMKFDDVRIPSRKRSESRLKRYSSVANSCIWAHDAIGRKKYIIDMMAERVDKKPGTIGEFIPVKTVWHILSAQQKEIIAHLKAQNACFLNLFRVMNFTGSQIYQIKQLIHSKAFTLIQDVSFERICEENASVYNDTGVQVQPKTTNTISATESFLVSVAVRTDNPSTRDVSSHMDINSMLRPNAATATESKSSIHCSIQVTPESPLRLSKSVIAQLSKDKLLMKSKMSQTSRNDLNVSRSSMRGIGDDLGKSESELDVSEELVTVLSECNQTSLSYTPTSVIQLFKSSNPSSIASIGKHLSDASNMRQSLSDSLVEVEDRTINYCSSDEHVYVQECGIQCTVLEKSSFLHNIISNIKNCVSFQITSAAPNLITQSTYTRSLNDIGTNTKSVPLYIGGTLLETVSKAMLQIESIQQLLTMPKQTKLIGKRDKQRTNLAVESKSAEMLPFLTKTSEGLIAQLNLLKNYYQELKEAETYNSALKKWEPSPVQVLGIPDDPNMANMALELDNLRDQLAQMAGIAEECDALKELVRCLQNDLALYNNVKAEFMPLQVEGSTPTSMMEIQDMLAQIIELKRKAEHTEMLEKQIEKERHDTFVALESLRRLSSSRKLKEMEFLRLECNRLQLKVVDLEAKVREKERHSQQLIADADEGFKEDLSFASEQAEEIEMLNKEKESLLKALVTKECELAEQEEQIERLVEHVDRLTTNNELQQEKSHKLLAQLRSQLDAKESYIAKMDHELQYVEERLKSSISTICRDSSELQQKVITLECACQKYKAQISEMETGRKVMQKQLRIQDELNQNYSLELQRKQNKIQQLMGERGEPHFQQKMQRVNKMEDILRKSHMAMRRVVEELSKKYTEDVTGLQVNVSKNMY